MSSLNHAITAERAKRRTLESETYFPATNAVRSARSLRHTREFFSTSNTTDIGSRPSSTASRQGSFVVALAVLGRRRLAGAAFGRGSGSCRPSSQRRTQGSAGGLGEGSREFKVLRPSQPCLFQDCGEWLSSAAICKSAKLRGQRQDKPHRFASFTRPRPPRDGQATSGSLSLAYKGKG